MTHPFHSLPVTSHAIRLPQRLPLKANPWPNLFVFFNSLSYPQVPASLFSLPNLGSPHGLLLQPAICGSGVWRDSSLDYTSRPGEITVTSTEWCLTRECVLTLMFFHLRSECPLPSEQEHIYIGGKRWLKIKFVVCLD